MFRWARATLGVGMNGDSGFMRPTRVPHRVLYSLLFTLIVVLVVLLLPSRSPPRDVYVMATWEGYSVYNSTYPLTPPRKTAEGTVYRIGLVADCDESSKVGKQYTWKSYLKTGWITLDAEGNVSVQWDSEMEISSHVSEKGRGTELSELIVFNGKLYTVDDRTGIVFEVVGERLVPWVILEDGPGRQDKGFKGEWMAVKDHTLYVGGLGKEWTTADGTVLNDHPQYVKAVSPQGHVTHIPWASNYNRIKESLGINPPGYVIHEAVCWSGVHGRWFFLPRRASKESYNDIDDEHRATNVFISSDELFSNIKSTKVGVLNSVHGFSSFKFIPNSDDSLVLAVKSEENKGKIASYIMAFDLKGKVIMEEQKIADLKYEGVEFI